MSNKARGTGTGSHQDDLSEVKSAGIPEGEELSIDPGSGDQLDPPDRWWDDSNEEEKELKKNRRVSDGDSSGGDSIRPVAREGAETKEERSEDIITEPEEAAEVMSISERVEDPDSDSPEVAILEGNDEIADEESSKNMTAEPEETAEVISTSKEEPEAELDSPENVLIEEGDEPPSEEDEDGVVDLAPLVKKSKPADDKSDFKELFGDGEKKSEEDSEIAEEVDLADVEEVEVVTDLEDLLEDDTEEGAPTEEKLAPIPVLAVAEKPKPVVLDEIEDDTADEDSSDQLEPLESLPTEVEADEPEKIGLGEMLDNADAVAPQKAEKQKRGCWTIFATLFFFLTLIVVVAIGVVGYLAWTRLGEFEAKITETAQSKLAEKGVFLDYAGWEYAFPRGLILNDITLYESEAKEVPLLKASDIGVNVDILGLIKDRSEVKTAEVSFAESSLTFFEGGEQVGGLNSIRAEILVSSELIQVERFSALIGGLRINASGHSFLPKSEPTQNVAASDGAATAALPIDFALLKQVEPWLEIQANGEPPQLDVQFSNETGVDDTNVVSVNARLSGRDFDWRGVSVSSVSGACRYESAENQVEVTSLQIGHGEGFVGGVFSIDLESKTLYVTKSQSTVDLVAVLSEYDSEWSDKLKSISLVDAPMIQLSGTVPMDSPDQANLMVDYDHRMGLVYHGEDRDLPLSELRGRFKLSSGSLETNNFAGRVLNGAVRINGTTRLTAESKPFSGLIEVSELPLEKVASYFELGDIGMTGNLFFDFRGIGYSDVLKVRGGGSLRIDDALLTGFPVIGPVQELLGKVIPAFGVKGTGMVSGAYIVESGVLMTNDLTVRQGGANLVVAGSLALESKNTDFTATASLDSALSKATGLEGKSVVVTGIGQVASPKLMLTDFPIDFASDKLNDILGTSPDTLQNLEGILGGEEDAMDMIQDQLEEASGIELPAEIGNLFKGILDAVTSEAAPVEVPAAVPLAPRAQPVE